ncbi:MAG: sulfotransferase [Pseudoxanthomonas sp.]
MNAGHAPAAADPVEIQLRLSAAARQQDAYRRARQCALNAVQALLETRQWAQLPFVTLRLLEFDERALISVLIAEADADDRRVLAQAPVLSQHLWLVGEYDAALHLIERAIARGGDHPLLRYSRANALRYCGRLDEATADYERCIALSPDYAWAHWSLAYHRKSDTPGARIARIRQARAAAAAGSAEYAALCYALFKEGDDAGDTGAAWTALQEGAGTMRRRIRYDPAREADCLERLQRLDWRFPTIENDVETVPVFVFGMPRTGTTLLERILSNHDGVASAGELNDFAQALGWASDHFFAGGQLDAAFAARCADVDFGAAGRAYLRRTHKLAQGNGFLIDKNPLNVFNAGYIRRALPHAKMLCLSRNPMDACFSNLKELFGGNAYGYSYDLDELAGHWLRFDRLRAFWQAAMPESFLTVDYEELVADPIGTARRVAGFCGMPFSDASVAIENNASPVATASSSQVRQPINGRHVGAWKRYADGLAPLRRALENMGMAR